MGVFKKYAPCIVCDGLRLDNLAIGNSSQQQRPVPTWHDINGNAYTDILATYNPNSTNRTNEFWRNISSFATNFLTPVATSDVLENYDVNDYGITAIGETTKSNSITKSTNSIENIYSIRITNNASSEDIVVKCIKFKKGLYTGVSGSSTVNERITLYCAYFLDESEFITIPPGESRNLVIDFAAVIS